MQIYQRLIDNALYCYMNIGADSDASSMDPSKQTDVPVRKTPRGDGSFSNMTDLDKVFLATAVGVPVYTLFVRPEMEKKKKERELEKQLKKQQGGTGASSGMATGGSYMPMGGNGMMGPSHR